MTDLTLPGDYDGTTDINHPRHLLIMWRAEAGRLANMVGHTPDVITGGKLLSRATALRQCASELENRLLWSGLS